MRRPLNQPCRDSIAMLSAVRCSLILPQLWVCLFCGLAWRELSHVWRSHLSFVWAWDDVVWGFLGAGVANIMAYSWFSHCRKYLEALELEKRFIKTQKVQDTETPSAQRFLHMPIPACLS